jgi:transposase
LASYRDRRCRKSEQQIAEHLTGTWRDEHLFVLKQCLEMYDFILEQLNGYREQINVVLNELQSQSEISLPPAPEVANKAKRLRMKKRGEEPVRVELYPFCGVDLTRIDGISSRTAETLLSELGKDLSSFPNEKHFVSYVSLAPRLARSGGKTIRKRKQGNAPNRIGIALRTAATTLKHSKTALGAEYRRIARKKSAGVVVFCMARKLAKLIYRMLRWGIEFQDEGLESYDTRFQEARIRSCREFAKSLGFKLLPVETADACG